MKCYLIYHVLSKFYIFFPLSGKHKQHFDIDVPEEVHDMFATWNLHQKAVFQNLGQVLHLSGKKCGKTVVHDERARAKCSSYSPWITVFSVARARMHVQVKRRLPRCFAFSLSPSCALRACMRFSVSDARETFFFARARSEKVRDLVCKRVP